MVKYGSVISKITVALVNSGEYRVAEFFEEGELDDGTVRVSASGPSRCERNVPDVLGLALVVVHEGHGGYADHLASRLECELLLFVHSVSI